MRAGRSETVELTRCLTANDCGGAARGAIPAGIASSLSASVPLTLQGIFMKNMCKRRLFCAQAGLGRNAGGDRGWRRLKAVRRSFAPGTLRPGRDRGWERVPARDVLLLRPATSGRAPGSSENLPPAYGSRAWPPR